MPAETPSELLLSRRDNGDDCTSVRVTDTVQVSPAVMVMTGTLPPPPPLLLLLLLDALLVERGTQSDVSTNGMCTGGGFKAGLTTTAVKF